MSTWMVSPSGGAQGPRRGTASGVTSGAVQGVIPSGAAQGVIPSGAAQGVIPSGAAQRRSRGISIVPVEGQAPRAPQGRSWRFLAALAMTTLVGASAFAQSGGNGTIYVGSYAKKILVL